MTRYRVLTPKHDEPVLCELIGTIEAGETPSLGLTRRIWGQNPPPGYYTAPNDHRRLVFEHNTPDQSWCCTFIVIDTPEHQHKWNPIP